MKSAWKEETGFFFTNFCQWFRIFENDLLCQKKMHNAKDGMVRAAKMCLEVSTNICDGIFWKSVSSHSFKRIARTSPNLTHHHFYFKLIWCQSLMTIWKPESPNSEFDLGASGGLVSKSWSMRSTPYVQQLKEKERKEKRLGEKAYIFTIGCSFEDNASQEFFLLSFKQTRKQ